jgi:hypothetical protein
MRMTMTTRRRMNPSTLDIHYHDGSTVMTSKCTKSFHALRIDQIGMVREATLIVALINNMIAVMMILLLKLSLLFLPFMVCMMPRLILIGR